VPKRLEINDEEIAGVLGCDREEYKRIMGLESWHVERHERGYLFLGINIGLRVWSEEEQWKNDLEKEKRFFREKNSGLGGRSLLEMMAGNNESLTKAYYYVLDIGSGRLEKNQRV